MKLLPIPIIIRNYRQNHNHHYRSSSSHLHSNHKNYHHHKHSYSNIVFFIIIIIFTIFLTSLPNNSECKVKKLKTVKKLLKAKVLLKPLLKAGVFKLPMVHFVIPIVKQGRQGLGFLTPAGPAYVTPPISPPSLPSPRRRIKCSPLIPIGSRPCPLGTVPGTTTNSGGEGSIPGLSDILGNIPSLPRLNLAGGIGSGLSGLFNSLGFSSIGNKNNCQQQQQQSQEK